MSLLASLVLLGGGSANAPVSGREDTTVASVAHLVADDTLDPRIVELSLTGPVWEAQIANLDSVLFAQRQAERRVEAATAALGRATTDLETVENQLRAAVDSAADLDAQIQQHRSVLQQRALALFVSFGDDDRLDELDSIAEATAGARHRHIASEIDARQFELLDELEARRSGLGATVAELRADQSMLSGRIAAQQDTLEQASTDLAAARASLPEAIAAVRRARRGATISGLDMSVVAFDAYLRAERMLEATDPTCGLGWWMIAGVGRVESRHGELGGRTVLDDGRPNRPIIGIALDGGPGVRAIVDTDDGGFDGDTEWDRAVGPMQFIPETWSIRGRDGNGDDRLDPHNLYDAALAAGTYLCRLGGDLREADNLRTAYFGYNTSEDYVDLVEAHALRYADSSL
ncbi:MAG: hypothetical protein AAGC53_13025 [Actinomycetota bacterium]